MPTKKTSLTCQSEAADILSEYGNLWRGDRKRRGVKHRTQEEKGTEQVHPTSPSEGRICPPIILQL